jgi:hypothetical protein
MTITTGPQKFLVWVRDLLTEKNYLSGSEHIYIEDAGESKKASVSNTISTVIQQLPSVTGIFQYDANSVISTTSNTYTLSSINNGKMLVSSNTLYCNVFVTTELSNNFSCIVLNEGGGVVTISNTGNSFIHNSSNSYIMSAKYSSASIFGYGVANNYILTGDVI